MKTEWLNQSVQTRLNILEKAGEASGLPPVAVEKDWWVTEVLRACFSLSFSRHFIFKGGTSLSKAWGLMQRFSEDIDLAVNRDFWGYAGDISKSQIKMPRKKSCQFVNGPFAQALQETLAGFGLKNFCTIHIEQGDISDKDPAVVQVVYESLFNSAGYLQPKVIIEMGARSLKEPVEKRSICSVINEALNDDSLAGGPFQVPAVLPQRTFLEKIFLLHEEFAQNRSQIRLARLSRHLYDIVCIMDTPFGQEALDDAGLYRNIVAHRQKFNALRGIDYGLHKPETICIIPPDSVVREWERDYIQMTESMIYGKYLSFKEIMERIRELQHRIQTIQQ